ncbi:UNVERIFIED_CONTAM: hypothetical protein NCL1_31022 [Trichonephila clavipes]
MLQKITFGIFGWKDKTVLFFQDIAVLLSFDDRQIACRTFSHLGPFETAQFFLSFNFNRDRRCPHFFYIHWCAKIKDKVEKLAYQLNEEAERTERPIRKLSKVMYGSTCADMQVDI